MKTINLKTQILKLGPTKTPNLIMVMVFFMIICFSVKGQVYIHADLVVSIDKEFFIVSTASINQIDASIEGNGVFILNAKHPQLLQSSKAVLSLPNLRLKNADLVSIETLLELKHDLMIESGTLVLSKDLYLQDAAALQLSNDRAVVPTPSGQLIYKSQITENHSPLAVVVPPLAQPFVTPTIHTIEVTQWLSLPLSKFESIAFCFYQTPYMNLSTPPPEAVLFS